MFLFSSELGMAWVFLGISLGLRPREIPRKTHAIPRSDEKSTTNFLQHLTHPVLTDLINNSAIQYICAKSFGCVVDIYLFYVHTSFGAILFNIE